MNISNLSKIEVKNLSINSSCKSISRFEEQKDMIQLLDNQLKENVNIFINYNFFLFHRIEEPRLIRIIMKKMKMILFIIKIN